MSITPVYRDLYIDNGADLNVIVELTVPFADYTFYGAMRKSLTSSIIATFQFEEIINQPRKMIVKMIGDDTRELTAKRYFYDIYAVNATTGVIHKEREGQVQVGPRVTEFS